MNNKQEVMSNGNANVLNIASSLFGIAVLAAGFINTFWGNDPGFGIFLALLSFVYFPVVNAFLHEKFGFVIPPVAKVFLGIFIIWAALGVGELFDKIGLMMQAL